MPVSISRIGAGHTVSETLKLKTVTEPADLPLSLNEAKAFLRLDDSFIDDDALVMAQVRAATTLAEKDTGRSLINRQLRLTRDTFGDAFFNEPLEGFSVGPYQTYTSAHIDIPKPPLVSVDTFVYFLTDNTETTVPAATYFVDDQSEPGRIGLQSGQTWPSAALRPDNAVQVTFTAGYGENGFNVPSDIREAIKLTLGHFYENRFACEGKDLPSLPKVAQVILGHYRILSVF